MRMFWYLHEIPWSVISAIVHEWDMTFSVTLSMMNTYQKSNKTDRIVVMRQINIETAQEFYNRIK